MAICSVHGCNRPTKYRGLCCGHYYRLKRYGDPTAGQVMEGEQKRYFEEVVLSYRGADCLIWPYSRSGRGYARMSLSGHRRVTTSRLACEIVWGPPPTAKHQAAHSCGNGHLGCVNPLHLSWKTPKQNSADKLLHGTAQRGEKNWRAVLTAEDVQEVRRLKGKEFSSQIAARLGVTKETVKAIHQGRTWSWLPHVLEPVQE